MSVPDPHPINVRLIDHVVIRVRDFEKMIAFYSDVLGLKLEKGPDELGLAQLRAGESLVDLVDAAGKLGRAGGDMPDHDAPNMDHLCLQVLPWEIDAIRAHLEKHGIEPGEIAERYGAQGRGPSMYISDPEGNTVELKGPPGQ